MPGAMIYGSVGNSYSRLRFFQQLRDISDALRCSPEDTWNMIVILWRRWIRDDGFPPVISIPPVGSDPTKALVRFAWMLLCLVCLHLSRSDPFQLYERRGRELLGLPPATNNSIVDPTELLGSGGARPGTNNSIVLTQYLDPIQEYERMLGLSLGLGRALLSPSNLIQRYRELDGTGPVVINNSIVLNQSGGARPGTNNSIVLTQYSDPIQECERRLGPSIGLGRALLSPSNLIQRYRELAGTGPVVINNSIVVRQSYPNQLYERQTNRGTSWMMRDGITVEAVDLEAGLINGENRRMTESSQEHNLFDSNQLPKVILGVTCQAVFSLLGALALINTQFSLEFKILAIVLAFGFISSLVSMLISKGKLRKSLIKVGAVSVSSAVIVAVAMLLRVDKMWMWIIAGAVSVLPLITVIRS